jgi:hypothetical protein
VAAAAEAPVPAVARERRRVIPRPSRATLVRDAILALLGGGAGVTIGLAAHFHRWHDKDSPTLIALISILAAIAVLMTRVDWARRAGDAVIVVVTMLFGVGLLLGGIGLGHPLMHFVHHYATFILIAVGGVLLGGGVATRLARASA